MSPAEIAASRTDDLRLGYVNGMWMFGRLKDLRAMNRNARAILKEQDNAE